MLFKYKNASYFQAFGEFYHRTFGSRGFQTTDELVEMWCFYTTMMLVCGGTVGSFLTGIISPGVGR